MSAPKLHAAIADVAAGTTLIMVGFAEVLVRLGLLDLTGMPQWSAIEHWWPLLLIIAGLVIWLVDVESTGRSVHSGRSVEMPYGK